MTQADPQARQLLELVSRIHWSGVLIGTSQAFLLASVMGAISHLVDGPDLTPVFFIAGLGFGVLAWRQKKEIVSD